MKISHKISFILLTLFILIFGLKTLNASSITTINGSDTVSGSRTTINTNFSNLNTDKVELSNTSAWTTLQKLFANASTTGFSTGYAYFGATATSSFSNTGVLTLATTTSGCLNTSPTGLVYSANCSTGSVTAVSVASANGFSGSSSGGATPALTLGTTITGLLKGNGTAISAGANGTDYTLLSATSCSAGQHISAVTASGAVTCSADTAGSSFGEAWTIGSNIYSQSMLKPTTTQNIHVSGTGTSTYVGGIEAWRQIASPYFHATSTTATSTFAGGVTVQNFAQTGSASSTFANGIQLASGCFRMPSGTCLTSGGGGGTPGGSDGQVQYNSSGSFAGDPNLTWDSGFGSLFINGGGDLSVNGTEYSETGINFNGGDFLEFPSEEGTIALDDAGQPGYFPYYADVIHNLSATSSIYLSTAGRIGIGSTSPGSLFSIGGDGTGWNFFNNGTTTSYAKGINLKNGGCFAINGTCIGGGSGSGTVTSVGVSTPNSTLTIGSSPVTTSGTITADLNLTNPNTWTGLQQFTKASSTQFSVNTGFYVGATGSEWAFGTTTSALTSVGKALRVSNSLGGQMGAIQVVGSGGGGALTMFSGDDAGDDPTLAFTGNSLTFSNLPQYTTLSGMASKMKLTSTGLLGLGTSTPWAQLSVNPNGVTGAEFAVGSTTSTHFVIDNGGKVGINTASPSNRLQVNLLNNEIAQLNDGSNASAICGINGCMVGQSSQMQLFAQGTNPLVFLNGGTRNSLTAGTENMRLTFGGSLGLGTSSPTSQFNVASSSSGTTLTTYQTAPNISITNSNTTVNNFSSLDFRTTNSSGADVSTSMITGIHAVHTAASESGALAFHTDNAGSFGERMRIIPSGLLGLGTSTPPSLLTVGPTSAQLVSSNPVMLFGTSTLTSASANGTYIGVNAPTGFTGNFVDMQLAGAARFSVSATGVINGSNNLNLGPNAIIKGGTGGDILLQGNCAACGATDIITLGNGQTLSHTSGDVIQTKNLSTFAPSSGTGTYEGLAINDTINQTVSASGISRSFLVSPTLTKASDYRAIETAAYTLNVAAGSLATTRYGSLFNAYTLATTSSGTLANASLVNISGAPKAGTNMTISTSTALLIDTVAVNPSGTVTKAYGLQIFAPTGATSNYGASIMNGNVGIGTSSPFAVLSTQGSVALNGLTAFATGDSAVCQRAGGELTVDSGVSSCIVSSKYTKDFIAKETYEEARRKIDALNVIVFKYKDSGKEDIGMYAEEVAKVDPRYAQYASKNELMDGHQFKKGDPKAINWTAIQADMIVVLQHEKGGVPEQKTNTLLYLLNGMLAGSVIYLFLRKK